MTTKPRTSAQAAKCAACRLPADQKAELNLSLALDRITQSQAAALYDISRSTIWRHRQRHLPMALLRAFEDYNAPDVSIDALTRQIADHLEALDLRFRQYRAQGLDATGDMLKVIEQGRKSTDSLARLLGLVQDRVVEVTPLKLEDSEEWQELQAEIIDALDEFPDARVAVIKAIRG